MFDAGALLNQFLGADASQTIEKGKEYLNKNAGTLAGGAALGGLGGYMLGSKKGRKLAKNAATYGGMALLAGLAYKAYNNHQNKDQKQSQTSPTQEAQKLDQVPQNSAFNIDNQEGGSSFGATLISAMIAAAKADGQIDGDEHKAIFSKIEELNLRDDEKAFLFDQINAPMDIDSLVEAGDTKEQAIEIYVASLMAIDVDTQAEKAYLSMLAARLNLEEDLVSHIHDTVDQGLE
jgi:uncharacterized membrane protein YebE (DUF533 family)